MLVLLHLVGMVSKLKPEYRSGLSTMLADDINVLARCDFLPASQLSAVCLY